MKNVLATIESAQMNLHTKLKAMLEGEGMKREGYVRYLSMQYHLTKGVQKPFYRIAGSDSLKNKKSLREFLVEFADVEAPHYSIAEKDLNQLGETTGNCPFEVEIWWAYFNSVIDERPYLRLGATCVLENISNTSGALVKSLMQNADYINSRNSVFLTIHMHGDELPHGDQILQALEDANLTDKEWADIEEGAHKGGLMFSRMLDWAFNF